MSVMEWIAFGLAVVVLGYLIWVLIKPEAF